MSRDRDEGEGFGWFLKGGTCWPGEVKGDVSDFDLEALRWGLVSMRGVSFGCDV